MTITPYTPDIIKYDLKPYEHNLQLIQQTLAVKQREFDTNYQYLSNLRNKALSINFINSKEQEKVDAFNSKINAVFSQGEFGNLADSNQLNKYVSLFNEIGNNQTLISRYRQDKGLRDQYTNLNKLKQTKDPHKNGYHRMNEAVFMNDLNKYASADLNKESVEVSPYVPYFDYMPQFLNGLKQAHAQGVTYDQRNPDGSITRVTKKGVDYNQAHNIMSSLLDRARPQLEIEAKYRYLSEKQSNPEVDNVIYDTYTSRIKQSYDSIGKNITQLEAEKKNYIGKTDDSSIALIEQKEQQIAQLKKQQTDLAPSVNLDRNIFNQNPLGYHVDNYIQDKLNTVASAWAYKEESQTIRPDDIYFKNAQLELANRKLEIDAFKAKGKISAEDEELATTINTNDPEKEKVFADLDEFSKYQKSVYYGAKNIADGGYTLNDNNTPVSNDNLLKSWLSDPNFRDNPIFQNNASTDALKLWETNVLDWNNTTMTDEEKVSAAKEYVNRVLTDPKTPAEEEVFNKYQLNGSQLNATVDYKKQKEVEAKQYNKTVDELISADDLVENLPTETIYFGNDYYPAKQRPAINKKKLDYTAILNNSLNQEEGYVSNIDPKHIQSVTKSSKGTFTFQIDPTLFQSTDTKDGLLDKKKIKLNGVEQKLKPTVTVTAPQHATYNASLEKVLQLSNRPVTQRYRGHVIKMMENQDGSIRLSIDYKDVGDFNHSASQLLQIAQETIQSQK